MRALVKRILLQSMDLSELYELQNISNEMAFNKNN